MSFRSNVSVFGLAFLSAVFAMACGSRQLEPSEQCGGTRDYPDGDPSPEHFDPDRNARRYVEVDADPKEFAANAVPNWVKTPLDILGADVKHQLPTEQLVWRSIPFYIELPEEYAESRAFLKYKIFGSAKWVTLEMKRHGSGRVAMIPCIENNVTGDVRYFFVLQNEAGADVGGIGSPREALRMQVRNELEGGQPFVAGLPWPTRCVLKSEAADVVKP